MSDLPVARSALHRLYAERGVERALQHGWDAPMRFGPVDAEVRAARAAVGVGELFGGGVLDVVGRNVEALAVRLDVAHVPVGAAVERAEVWSQMQGAAPGASPGGRWLRLTREHARVLGSHESIAAVRAEVETVGGCLHATDISSSVTALLVVGPRSHDLLARLVRVDLDPRVFVERRLALTGAAGIPVQILRWDRGPLLAYELMVGRDVAEYFWNILAHAGDGLGLRWIGTDAVSQLAGDGEPPTNE